MDQAEEKKAKPKWHSTSTPGVRYREHARRKHGKRLDRYYMVRFRVDGRLYESFVGWWSEKHTEAEAVALLAELKKNARTASGPVTLNEKKSLEDEKRQAREAARAAAARAAVTVTEFWNSTYEPALEASKKSSNTQGTEKNWFNRYIKDAIGDRPLRTIGKLDVARVAKAVMDAGKAPRSAQYTCAVLRQLIGLAIDLGAYQGTNPVRMRDLRAIIGKEGLDNRRLRTVTADEFNNLLVALGPGDVADACILAFDCGLRASEAFTLRWQHVNLAAGTLTLVDTKSRNRVVRLSARASDALKARPAGEPADLVFPPSHGVRRVYAKAFTKAINAIGLNDGIKQSDRRMRVVFHSLRHYAAHRIMPSRCVEAGRCLLFERRHAA